MSDVDGHSIIYVRNLPRGLLYCRHTLLAIKMSTVLRKLYTNGYIIYCRAAWVPFSDITKLLIEDLVCQFQSANGAYILG